MDIKERIFEVLTNGSLMSLATVDESGPWVSDLIYINDPDLHLYWISRKKRRHSQALRKNSKVAATITISPNPQGKDLGIQLEGTAEELTEVPSIADQYWQKRGEGPKLPITEEHAWYKLTPKKIDLIDEATFNNEKQTFIP